MTWLLNFIYGLCLVICSPWLLWRYLFQNKSRRGWSHKLFGAVPTRTQTGKCVWFHAVSVGEVNLLAKLINRLRICEPEIEIVISTSTETGFDLAKSRYSQHQVFFCPMDFSWAVKRTLRRIRPAALVLTELELWPNLILIARRFGVPVMVANARLSEDSFRGYRRWRFLVGRMLTQINLVAVQNETYAQRFRQLGCEPAHIVVTGNVKFDDVQTQRNNPPTLELKKLLPVGKSTVFLAGSTQVEEDLLAISVFKTLSPAHPDLRLIIVPRHPDRSSHLAKWIAARGMSCVLRSRLRNSSQLQSGRVSQSNPILIVDVIGELSAWWGLADVGFVGGSMGKRGGQNMIEPAAYGIPICFGPRTENFRLVVEQLLAHRSAEVVNDQQQLQSFVERAIQDPEWAVATGLRAQRWVLKQRGAADQTVASIMGLIDGNESTRSKAA